MTLSDVGGELVQSLYLLHTSVSCQPARYTYIVPAHSKPSYTMTSPSIVRLINIATEYSYENLEFLKEALPSVSTTATPCIYHHVNPFASNCHDYPPHEFVLHCPNELLPEIFHAIQSAINGQDAPTYNYEFQHSNGLNDYGVRATICHADYALPLTWTSTSLHSHTILHTYLTTSALLDPWTILLSANYNNFADFVQALRKQVQLSNTALVFVYTACTTYHIHPANESTELSTAELLSTNEYTTSAFRMAPCTACLRFRQSKLIAKLSPRQCCFDVCHKAT